MSNPTILMLCILHAIVAGVTIAITYSDLKDYRNTKPKHKFWLWLSLEILIPELLWVWAFLSSIFITRKQRRKN